MGGKDATEEQVAPMREAFSLFDTDGDGRIAVSELGILMRSLGGNPTQAQLKEIVAQEHLTGPFDFPRFLELMRKHLKPEPFDRQLRDAFRVLDKDGSGLVAVSDLRHILTSIGEKLDPAEFDEWIREVDVGADGNIRYEDFILRMVAKGVNGPGLDRAWSGPGPARSPDNRPRPSPGPGQSPAQARVIPGRASGPPGRPGPVDTPTLITIYTIQCLLEAEEEKAKTVASMTAAAGGNVSRQAAMVMATMGTQTMSLFSVYGGVEWALGGAGMERFGFESGDLSDVIGSAAVPPLILQLDLNGCAVAVIPLRFPTVKEKQIFNDTYDENR
ncbi:hypothetical protein Taro_034429 [Colocasia esculenta]|uniref:EF-hand domain-containing protein n=1 Tax=Colocasia esculenta TaxID=4460 RepID=A0A843W417_COLES|nr:hypothetical protein [Colocasia esculenta]